MSFPDQLSAFEAAHGQAWEECCETMKLCMMREDLVRARWNLERFAMTMAERVGPTPLDTHVQDFFRVEVANALERAGFENLAEVSKATDEELLAIPNFSLVRVAGIRTKIAEATDTSTDPEECATITHGG